MTKQWTHDELCKKAVAWLKRPNSAGGCGCPNAYSEVKSGSNGGEIVDAIGLKTASGTESVVVEVKVSRSDFLADKKKAFRKNSELGMGNFRYYMCPENLIREDELPPKWGLIYIGRRGKATVISGHRKGSKKEWFFESNRDAELGMASLLLAKSGDFEHLNDVSRLNQRLEAKVRKLQVRLEELERPIRYEELIRGLDEMATSLKPIPKAVG